MRLPSLYIPHGGGPCFFMDWTLGPADTWEPMQRWLESIGSELGARPEAILVISAHWEAQPVGVTGAARPVLIYDYYGFPEHTYELTYPVDGSPSLACSGEPSRRRRTGGIADPGAGRSRALLAGATPEWLGLDLERPSQGGQRGDALSESLVDRA